MGAVAGLRPATAPTRRPSFPTLLISRKDVVTDRDMKVDVLIIGGTAAYWVDITAFARAVTSVTLETPFGKAPPITVLELPEGLVGFTSRHGEKRLRRSARFVNHRAYIAAAQALGVRWILSWNGVGSLQPDWAVGDLVLLSDVVDFTRGRVETFEGPEARDLLWQRVVPPFAEEARAALRYALSLQSRPWHPKGVYACTEGPRLETAAEIRLLRLAGADVVGMTLCPEVWLAGEVGIGYAALGYITNHATGIVPRSRSGREFGRVVAETCLPILLRAAGSLLPRLAC